MTEAQEAGPKPELGWLPVARLRVDERYQRSLQSRRSQALIDRLTEHFNWSAFQAIVATPDGDGWLIIDGQHRTEAARRRGETHIPAVIVKDADLAAQAAIFVSANQDRVSVTAFSLYHARLVAGENEALAVARLCAAAGLIIPRHQPIARNLKPGETAALGTLQALIRRCGEERATLAAKVVADAYRETPVWLKASLFKACAEILARSDDELAARAGLCRALEATGGRALFAKALATKAAKEITETQALVEELKSAMRSVPSPAPGEVARMVADDDFPVFRPSAPKVQIRRGHGAVDRDERGMPVVARPPEEPDEITTPGEWTGAKRFAMLVRQGASMERLAGYFGISVEEAKRRANALERRT